MISEIRKMKGSNWCECMLLDENRNNIGEARFEKDYDELGSAIFHFEIDNNVRRKGYGTLLLEHMIEMIKEKTIRIIIGEQCNDKGIETFLIKNGFRNVKPSKLYFAIEGIK